MSNLTPSVARLGAYALFALLPACGGDILAAQRQDSLPRPVHATAAEIAADPCKHGDLPRCAERCMERRDANSCNTVGVLLEYGPETDFAAAASYYGRACAAAYAPGCTGLAWLHLLGRGAKKDPVLAIALFTRAYDGYRLACVQGHLEGCVAAADFLIEGRGVEQNEAEARVLLEQACDHGEPRACERAKSLRLDECGSSSSRTTSASSRSSRRRSVTRATRSSRRGAARPLAKPSTASASIC